MLEKAANFAQEMTAVTPTQIPMELANAIAYYSKNPDALKQLSQQMNLSSIIDSYKSQVSTFKSGDAITKAQIGGEWASDAAMLLIPGGIAKGLGRIGLFGGGTEAAVVNEAVNHINGLRLQRLLTMDQAKSIFTQSGELTPEAIKNSFLIKPGEALGNSLLRNELTSISGDISGWGKYSTESIASPSGKFQMHFYHNSVTGDVYYGMNYKAVFDHQGLWDFELSPNFDYEPPQYRPGF